MHQEYGFDECIGNVTNTAEFSVRKYANKKEEISMRRCSRKMGGVNSGGKFVTEMSENFSKEIFLERELLKIIEMKMH